MHILAYVTIQKDTGMITIYYNLTSLPIGSSAVVYKLDAAGSSRRRLQDLGIIKGTLIEALQKSPSGDPTAYLIRGTVIALRSEDTDNIYICV